MASINEIIKSQMANATSSSRSTEHLPVELVDSLADELVVAYSNPEFRRWYCGVINKFGVNKVHEWRGRAADGKQPGRLFTVYVNQAGGYRS